jgi:predicted RNA-binding protein with PIN domain
MKQLEEEDPTLHVMWREAVGQVYINLMGPVQTEVLQQQIKDRFGVAVTFGQGQVRYKETIEGTAEGVGHFEPLRHYAEAHIRLEALPRGSGMEYAIDCPADMLDTNWQRLMYTHLTERIHKGVLTGAPLTDVRLTVVGGRAHKKHTEGGDFRQATYRAVRQGLRKAKSILLEPYYQVTLEVPSQLVGRAMTDMTRMQGQITPPEQVGETAILKGKAPVSLLRNYGTELAAYTGGRGRMELSPAGYFPCHDAQEVIAEIGYDADLDTENPCDSVFCAHGAGYVVPWYQVQDYMHVPLQTDLQEASQEDALLAAKAAAWQRRQEAAGQPQGRSGSGVGGLEPELEEIFVREFGEIRRRLPSQEKQSRSYDKQQRIASARQAYLDAHEKEEKTRPKEQKRFLLVDGYNVIFAWQELDAIARDSLDGARGRLMDIMCNYQAHIGEELILVFDAYRIQGHKEEIIDYHNIHVVYTREAETADAYIERTTHVMAKDYQVTVATSDRLEQMIVMGDGARRISARELEKEVQRVNEEALKAYRDRLRERK